MLLSLLLFLGAVVLSALTFFVVAYRDKKFSAVKLSDGLSKWLNSSHHWHTFAHFFLDFAIVMFIGVWLIFCAMLMISVMPFLCMFVFMHPVAFAFICMTPPTIITLYQELIYDGHLKGFFGLQKHDKFDFFFDVYTRLAGGATAALLIASLLTALF